MKPISKSEIKRQALVKATQCLVNNNGFHATPMSKIAKMAGVSPATIYLYFENKQDLVNKVYLEVKAAYTQFAFKDYSPKMSVKEGFEVIWKGIATFKLNHLEQAMFLAQCDSTPVIDEASRKEGIKNLQPLLDLWERGKAEGVIKPACNYLLYAYTINPLSFLLTMQLRGVFTLEEKHIQEAFEAAWDSIKTE
ncbi:TetR family transcriptional regulator [Polaribacter pacificus]|uniref:TetR family transcriptional regulator n=1 Tax=Polaribacter pacificus TaxID=1775173 RepID=A0A917HYF9_9FLAO|nr:TetR/AcrR family transcriptional regulator [Polaribacter pacificus]GGG98303.1 TetR family transcriptional regulator [Polaribacter pacificus]